MEIEFEKRVIGANPNIFIVGMCPGRQRKGDKNRQVFHGNRTGDLVESIIGESSVLLTNVFNYFVDKITPEIIERGIKELLVDLKAHRPYKVICLGNFSYLHVKKLITEQYFDNPEIKIVKLQHPSYVLRFNKEKNIYIQQFKEVLNDRQN